MVTREVTLKELVEAMSRYSDDETFRWFQASAPGWDGIATATETLRVSMGQVRRELGLKENTL